MTSRARPTLLPGDHVLRSALRAGQLIDEHGSTVERARTSYSVYASEALYPPSDLRAGEELLLMLGLLTEEQGILRTTGELEQIARIEPVSEALCALVDRVVREALHLDGPLQSTVQQLECFIHDEVADPERREQRLLELATKYDGAASALTGALGEECVVGMAQRRLREIGRSDLADRVVRVSLISDSLGYDVVVPRPAGRLRLEVKTSTLSSPEFFRFIVSRNEADWGRQDPDWYLVACVVRQGLPLVIGHCRASILDDYLPLDAIGGRWTAVEVKLPLERLQQGIPSLL